VRKELKITEEELFIARRGVSTRCAIAAAIMTQVPSARRIKVDQSEISWLDVERNERLVFRTPPSAQEFVRRWDNAQEVAPFTFVLSDAMLLARRKPKVRSREARIAAPLRSTPTKRPGLLMNRREENCEA
jgi:hypothetical protein